MKELVLAENAPTAVGPYSAALLVDDTLYISGMVPIDPKTNELVYGTVTNQINFIMKNIEAILNKADMSFENAIKATIFMKDMNDFDELNKAYGEYFKGIIPPVRSTVQVAQLPGDVSVEIEILAKR